MSAHFEETVRPEPRPLHSQEQQRLTALMRRRAQLLGMIQGGRGHVRRLWYMEAVAACRFNDGIRDFYQRLLGAGKPKKLAIAAR